MRSQAERFTQLINVYRAVGGGWVDEADKLAPKPMASGSAADAKATAAR